MPSRIHKFTLLPRLALLAPLVFIFGLMGCNSGGDPPSSNQAGTANNQPALTITSSGPLPGAQQGVSYQFNFTATGGTAPYSWALAGGTLPPGLSLSAGTGALSGTPSQSGNFSFSIQVKDSGGNSAQGNYSQAITSRLTITNNSLAQEVVGVPYSASLQASGGTAPYSWQLGSGQIPPGLTLSTGGLISGTPTTAGAYSVSFTVTDSSNPPLVASAPLSFNVVVPLTIDSTSLPNGAMNSAYNAVLIAKGGTAPYSWSFTGSLPPGLSLGTNGQLTGTPTSAGQYYLNARVSDSSLISQEASGTYVINVATSSSPVTIQTTTLPDGIVGSSYSASLQATGGAAPYDWALTSSQLPPGLGLSTSGQISGAPSASGQYSITVMAADSSSPAKSASRRFVFNIGRPLTITSSSLTNGTLNSTYSATLAAAGGTIPYSWSLASGTLPPSLSLSSNGQISGTTTATGQYSFVVKVTDASSNPQATTATFTITVNSNTSSLAIQTPTLPAGTMGASYSASLQATGGTSPYSWAIASGQLPSGLSLATNGQITGAPTASGTFSFTIRAQDSSTTPQTATATLSISVAAAPLSVTTTSLPQATGAVSYSATLQATGGTSPYNWSIASGQLPPGLGLATDGQISGAPSAGGNFNFTVKVQDSASTPQTATASLSIAVAAAPLSITTTSLSQATATVAYSTSLQASGGTTPYSWSLASGQLPAGLNLASSGQISGTPTASGTYNFSAKVSDSSSTVQTASVSLSITVAPPPLAITTSSMPAATVGTTYSASLQASGGTTPYSWTISSGQLPVGLSMTSGGQISGTPSAGGQYSLTFKVQDSSAPTQTASTSLTISVGSSGLSVITTSLPGGSVGTSYTASLQATGGTAPYSWALASGQLPTGLSLSTGGQISGTPTASGSYNFTAKVTDASNPQQTATVPLSITIGSAGLSVIPGSIDFGNVESGQTATQSVQLKNSGGSTLTISQASITGSAFTMSGLSTPLSLAPGQSAYFNVVFSPSTAGSAAGTVSLTSNDPSSPTSIALTGTSHWVTLNWTASTSTVVGYYVFRASVSGGAYTQLNATPINATSYDDSSVTPGQTYYYVVTAVDSNSVQSVYSNQAAATVPSP